MAEVVECPRCGVDRAMEPEDIWGARAWRCPECGHVWLPGTETTRGTGREHATHVPRAARSEDD